MPTLSAARHDSWLHCLCVPLYQTLAGKLKENEVKRAIQIRDIVTSLGPAVSSIGVEGKKHSGCAWVDPACFAASRALKQHSQHRASFYPRPD